MSENASPRRSRRRSTKGRRSIVVAVLATALTGGAVATGVLMSASASGPGAGTYRLVNGADDICLTAPAGGVQPGAAACDGSAAQVWKLADAEGGFTVTNGALCLGVQGDSTSAGKPVERQDCDGGAAQVWKLSAVGEAHHLVNGLSAKCLNLKGGLAQQNSCDKAATKSWTLAATTAGAPSATASSTSRPASPSASPTATAKPSATATRPATPTATATSALGAWPTPAGQQAVTSTIQVSGTYDGSLKRFYGSGALGDESQDEGQDPLFTLADGAVLKNVVLGTPAADGVHCLGSCTLQNVWWENVGEDAASFKGKSASAAYLVSGGGAKGADDKVFQHNGAGTLTIRDFQVSDFGKLYRSCGNCSTQYKRAVVVSNVKVTAPGKVLAGINTNYGDTATFSHITIVGDSSKKIKVCERFRGNSSGAEPTSLGSGPDGTYCRYSASDVTYS